MKLSTPLLLPFLLLTSASAFLPSPPSTFGVTRTYLSDEDPVAVDEPPPAVASGGALVPIKEETVEFTAGLIGGVAGFAVGGPVLGAIGAAAANYAAKTDGEISEVVAAVSKSSIQVYNYLASLDAKYEVLAKAKSSLEESLEKLKANPNVSPETVAKVEAALETTSGKINEINEEYDLVGATTTAFGVIGDLVEKAVLKAGELNEEYQLTSKATTALKDAVNKAKAAIGN